MTLASRLNAIVSEIDGFEKSGQNAAQGYRYVEASAVARAIRAAALKHGVSIVPSILTVATEQVVMSEGKGPSVLATVHGQVLLTDIETSEVMLGSWVGVGIDRGDKGVYKAITGGIKAYLRAAFLVPDETMDPEKDNASNDTGEVSDKAAAAEARTALRRAARSHATVPQEAPVPQTVEQAAPVEQVANVTEAVTPASTARGPRATKMASDALKSAIWARSHEVGLDEFQLKAMARTLTGKESSKDWSARDGEKVRAKLDNEATVELFRDVKQVAE